MTSAAKGRSVFSGYRRKPSGSPRTPDQGLENPPLVVVRAWCARPTHAALVPISVRGKRRGCAPTSARLLGFLHRSDAMSIARATVQACFMWNTILRYPALTACIFHKLTTCRPFLQATGVGQLPTHRANPPTRLRRAPSFPAEPLGGLRMRPSPLLPLPEFARTTSAPKIGSLPQEM